jgi:CIC family chloride channel protein
MALAIGLIVGIMAIFFNAAINGGVALTRTWLIDQNPGVIVLPIMGALISMGIYIIYLREGQIGLGIVQVLVELELIKTQLMRPFRVLMHVVGATVTLIFGFSAGRFGPIVHLGASIGSNIAYYLKLQSKDVRLLIGCGAAAAIAAVFHMPLFAAVFVLEVLYKKQFAEFFAPIVMASVVANFIGTATQNGQKFPVELNGISLISPELIWRYVVFGLIMGLISILYMLSIQLFTGLFLKMKHISIRLFVAAILIGLIGYFFPLNFELHNNTTYRALSGEFGLGLLVAIGLIKIFATGITLGSGYIGGNFYPGVTIGASLGVAFGKIIKPYGVDHSLFGLLGIGAMIAGYLNAPISGIILIIEFSGQYEMLIPALIVCALSVSTTFHLYGKDIFTDAYTKTIKNLV